MDQEFPTKPRITFSSSPAGSGDDRLLLSVVVPCFNEEEIVRDTNRRLEAALGQAPVNYEIIYVDDGSSDSTAELLRQLQQSDDRIRVIRFSRNFGHQMAITAGLEHVAGDAAVIIDADLQDPPEVILGFVQKWMDGYDVVYGVRADREGETAFKLWTAKAFYRCIARLSDTRIPLDTGDFRLMDRRVVNALLEMPERDRFVRGMVSWLGFSQVGVSYHREARTAGTTKFSFLKMLRFAMDGIFSFSVLPLRIATWIGFAASGIAIVGIIVAVIERLLGVHGLVKGWTSILIAVLFIGGVQLICMGIIGEYVGRTYGESKRRPLYVLRERIGFEARDGRSRQERRTRIATLKG